MQLFKLVGSIFIDNDEANKSLAKTDSKASSVASTLGKGVSTAAKWGTAIVGAAASAVTAIGGTVVSASEAGDEIDKMSQKLGLSSEAYQEWDYVMNLAGADINSMQGGMKTLANTMDDAVKGSKTAAAKFEALGISLKDLEGMSREDAFAAVVEGFQGMEDNAERAALANDLLGRSASELTPLFNQSAEATAEQVKQAHDLGMVMDEDVVKNSAALQDSITTMQSSIQGLGLKLAGSLMPIVQSVMDWVTDHMPQIEEMLQQIQPIIQSLFEQLLPPLLDLAENLFPSIMDLLNLLIPAIGSILSDLLPMIVGLLNEILPLLIEFIGEILPIILDLLDALMPLLQMVFDIIGPIIKMILNLITPLIKLIAEVLKPIIELVTEIFADILEPLMPALQELMDALTPLFEALGPVFMGILNALIPILKLVANVFTTIFSGALKDVMPIVTDIIGIFTDFMNFFGKVFTGDFEGAFEILKNIARKALNALLKIVALPVNGIITILNGIIGGLNKIKLPDWVPGIGGKGINIPEIPKVEMPQFAEGGIAPTGQMFIANEDPYALPEMVGRIGRNPVVANNAQIVEAVSQGVANAVSVALGTSGLAQQIADALASANIIAKVESDDVFTSVRNKNAQWIEMTGSSAFGTV